MRLLIIFLLLVSCVGVVSADYILPIEALSNSPADSVNNYFGWMAIVPNTSAQFSAVYVPYDGYIRGVQLNEYSGTAGSNEVYQYFIRINDTTDYRIQNNSVSANVREWSNWSSSMNISVSAGNYIQIKRTHPAWATNPATDVVSGFIYINSSVPGYTLWSHALTTNPADSNTNSFGMKPIALETSIGRNKIGIPLNGTIRYALVNSFAATVRGSAESHQISLNKSGGVGKIVGTNAYNTTANNIFLNSSLDEGVLTSNYVEFMRKNPVWVINPTGNYLAGIAFVNTSGTTEEYGYALPVQALTSTPGDNAVTYFGGAPRAPDTTAGRSYIYPKLSGLITKAYIYTYSGTAGTAESWGMRVRKSGNDYFIANLTASANERIFTNSSLTVPIDSASPIEIKSIQPNWATNPATTIIGGWLWFIPLPVMGTPVVDQQSKTTVNWSWSFDTTSSSFPSNFNHTMVYKDNVFLYNTSNFYDNWSGLTLGTPYEIKLIGCSVNYCSPWEITGYATTDYRAPWVKVKKNDPTTRLHAIVVYNDGTGDAIYTGTSLNGSLLKFNDSTETFTLVAPPFSAGGAANKIYKATVYDDGTGEAIFAGTENGLFDGAWLLKYNGTGQWYGISNASAIAEESAIYGITTYDDGTGEAVFSGTINKEKLLKYNTSLGNVAVVATKYGSDTDVDDLVVYNDGTGDALYTGGYPSGNVLKWNATSGSSWLKVGNNYSAGADIQGTIFDNLVWNGEFYSGSATLSGFGNSGYLLKYNKTSAAYENKTTPILSENGYRTLVEFNDGTGTAIFGGGNNRGTLAKYNTSLGNWELQDYPDGGESGIQSIRDSLVYKSAIWATSWDQGWLLKFNTTYAGVAPIAIFKTNKTSGASPLPVKFLDKSYAYSPTAWNWSMTSSAATGGNGTEMWFSTEQYPVVNVQSGNWTIRLNASNAYGYNVSPGTYWINVSGGGVSAPVASFTCTKDFVRMPTSISCTDTSTNTPTSWEWSWGDGTANSTTQNPSHQYTKRGKWDIYLTATNAGGSGATVNPTSIRVVGYDDTYH